MHDKHPEGETIKNRVLKILSDRKWHDQSEFLNQYLLR